MHIDMCTVLYYFLLYNFAQLYIALFVLKNNPQDAVSYSAFYNSLEA